MKQTRFTSLLVIIGLTSISMMAQAPICDVMCTPDPGGSTYAGAVASRPRLLNARGFSSPIQVTAGPQQVPMVAGSQSYNYVIPILSLPGRAGMDLNLNLYYNSRVWDIDTINGTATFNADRDFPSYGFRLDFGYLEYDVIDDQYILTERDGTKHALPNSVGYNSTDGTYINYNSASKVLTYKNGTTVLYAPFPTTANLFRPTQIKDTSGNFISIAYVNVAGQEQSIQSITDTLNRVITFHYVNNRLSYIDENLIGGGTRTYATFTWGTKYGTGVPWNNFSPSLVVSGAPDVNTPLNVLTSCKYANNTGYSFTYGDWAIINRIDNFSATPVTRSYVSYNYPAANAGQLTDAPTYTQQTVSPDGLDTNTSVWTYSASKAGTGVVTAMSVTNPPPIGSITVTNLDPSSGLLSSVQMEDSSSHVLRTISYVWVQSGAANVPGTITTTLNDTGQQSSVQYSAYDAYGNAGDVKEVDFGGTVLRHTVTTYTPLVPQHILNLPTSVLIKNTADTTIARTDLTYDDPNSVTINITDAANHDNTLTVHGNLTSISRYSDPVGPGGQVTRHFYYDSTGNVRTAELDCCNQKVFNFSLAKQYAYPDSVVRGTGVLQFTTSATWDFDTGLLLSSTDENGQVTGYQYDSMNRPTVVTLPPQGSTAVLINTAYDDSATSPTVTQSASPSTVTVPKTVTTMDGLGHVMRVDTKNGSTVVSSSTVSYDKLWRRSQASNPFGPAESPVNTSFSYDALGRTKLVTPPSGGFVQYDYSGNTVTVTDPAGKQRKNYTDALGRLVRVDEPGWGDALTAIDSISISGEERSVTTGGGSYCAQYNLNGDCVDWEFNPPTTTYDWGTVTATINGVAYSSSYGQSDVTSTVATNLAASINADPARVVNASPSGSTINLYGVNPGAAGNSVSVVVSSVTGDPTDFSAGTTSFPAATFTPTLTGGENIVTAASAVLSATRHLTTTYTYDVMNDLVSVAQGALGPVNGQQLAGQPRSYVYDGLGRLTSATTPESGTALNFYTPLSGFVCGAGDPMLVCRVQDARGVVKNFSYDGINRLVGVQYTNTSGGADPAGTAPVTYTYDTGGAQAFAFNRLTKITEGANSHTFVYDNFGRIKSDSQLIDTKTYLISYAYNLASQITSITYPSTTRVVVQNYDAIGRVCAIGASGSTCTTGTRYLNSPTYNAAGEALSVTFGNNVQGAFTYNDHLQLSTLRYFKSSTEILNLAYDYTSGVSGNNGQIQKVHYYTTPGTEDQTKSEQFTYDGFNRLSAAQTLTVNSTPGAKTWSLQWTYDRFGNRLTQYMPAGDPNFPVGQPTLIINPATNQITNSGYTYDNAGNMTHDANAAYAYDGANRLTNINTTAAVYSYFGPQRIKKVVGSTTTRYIYSGRRPIAEYVGTTNPTLSTEYIYAGSQLLVTIAGSTTTYHHPDHLSNRAETNSSGTRTRTFGHLPFGETWYETTPVDKWKFTSYERDSATGETGLDYANFRYYASGQGRFLNADFLAGHSGTPQSLNRYAYVLGDPVNLIDPLGLEASGSDQCPPGKIVIGTDEWGRNICGDPGPSGGGHGEHQPLQDGGGGGGGGVDGKPNCAGKAIQINYNLAVSSDQTGKINGVSIRLTGNDWVQRGFDGGAIYAGANTWAQITLAPSGALNISFNNPYGSSTITVWAGSGFAGAEIRSLTFSVNPTSHNNGNITQVIGAVKIPIFDLGFTDTPSDILKDALDGNSQLVNMLATVNAMMNLLHVLDCTLFARIGSL